MKKKGFLYFAIIVIITIIFGVAATCVVIGKNLFQSKQLITRELSDYGIYKGNHDNEFPQEFITSFFPDEIDNSFSDINFEYRAQKDDTYAFEAYLEFRIEDYDEFQAFIAEYIGNNVSVFPYDTDFNEYVIVDELGLVVLEEKTSYNDDYYHIQCAKIGKILYSEKTQQIIYIALGVYDGGAVTTEFLCNYFDRFNIKPDQYPTVTLY